MDKIDLSAWAPPTFAPPPAPVDKGSHLEYLDCFYSINTGHRPISLDAYVPKGVENPPFVMYVHGGAYNMGTRKEILEPMVAPDFVKKVLDNKIAFISIDYRLGYEVNFPRAIYDAKAAVRYVKKFGSVFGVNTDRMMISGGSAGGHLSGMVVATQGIAEWEDSSGVQGPSIPITAWLSWYGAMNLSTIVRPAVTPEIEAAFGGKVPDYIKYTPEYFNLGADAYKDVQKQLHASPVTHFSSSMVPTLFIHGDADRVVPYSQSVEADTKLRSLGVPSEIFTVKGADHVWMGASKEQLVELVDRSVAFIVQQSTSH